MSPDLGAGGGGPPIKIGIGIGELIGTRNLPSGE